MKSLITIFSISLIIFQYSCKSKIENEYKVGQHKIRIEIPPSFTEISVDEANKLSNEGIELFKQEGYTGFSNQISMFYFQKGEFSLLKAKKYDLEQNLIDNYENQWTKMKGILFDVLAKKTLEFDDATIDSTSSIKKIDGIEFYVFETNMYLLDLNNNQTNLKSLRYSTPIANQDLVIDASFINQMDGYDINRSLESIRIAK